MAAVTPDLFTNVLGSCHRVAAMRHTGQVARLYALIEAEAWVDAALLLVALELPLWKLRRLEYDEGDWHCALSQNRDTPEWLDASVDGRHADMALAIIGAFLEARRSREDRLPRAAIRRTGLLRRTRSSQ